ncbi:hypothetical protein TBLA_0B03770 [Henningerozyma blattae CBS 6284]|uniref:Uncharacterized protein n=1 Tax=Henningerozyma blattae (strain ATCC 34711 / CBS 6284 / DSM 70876 / NBRC 10599 / NRRL Y-10934 / UCD 77-7) TaxID=1071380 RepID=I2GYL4_HENB6|nr:hypothetical protein TBLA_0B03770 [Tetrapisispora blattae CBS 6284]CCH59216.1 hypothetical protein TBLA_0B03770 [Tetrapisispora blattae CBS 6284]
MDYEDILFGLQPIINASNVEDIPLQDVYLEGYLTVLDQLAVSLRAPDNRNVIGQSGLFSQLLRVLQSFLDICFHSQDTTGDQLTLFKLVSELIRCIANGLVDNDDNRKILIDGDITSEIKLEKKIRLIDYYIPRIFNLDSITNSDDTDKLLSTLQMRSIVLVKNLILENDNLIKRFSTYLRGPLFKLLLKYQPLINDEYEILLLASEILVDILDIHSEDTTVSNISILTEFIVKVAPLISSIDIGDASEENESHDASEMMEEIDDPFTDLILNFTKCLEIILEKNLKINFQNLDDQVLKIQTNLFESLNILFPKEFYNKLIVMRRLSSSVGYVSSNLTISNVNERHLCYNIIKSSQNGYQLAAAFILLSNSINSKQDADLILNDIPISLLIEKTSFIKDPMQFQGFLDLLRKLLSITIAMTLTQDELYKLAIVLKVIQDQTKYFTNLLPLLSSLLKKLITVLPSSMIQKLISSNDTCPILDIILENESLTSALSLDKLLVARTDTKDEILMKLWDKVFKFDENSSNGNNISISYLFQISKTLGIYFKNIESKCSKESDKLIVSHFKDILLVLETLLPLKNNEDNASKSGFNNGKFVAGMILKVISNYDILTSEETQLKDICSSFF